MIYGKVVFKTLILQGFGPYKNETIFNFTEGINSYTAANESGKTTMVSGILAVLFGLTHRQRSASPFNLERFRNWDNPMSCEGTLIFTSQNSDDGNETLYKIERNFDNHQISLIELNDDGSNKNIIAEGIHNPEAKKPHEAYEEELHRILGISSQELFEDVFFLMQPLPEADKISAELQGLLAGGKGSTFQNSLDKLENKLKGLTKYVGPNDRKVSSRNSSKDGILENLKIEVDSKKDRLNSSKEATDSLVELQKDVLKLNDELNGLKIEYRNKKNVQSKWSEWKLHENEYNEANKDHLKLEEAIKKVQELELEIKMLGDFDQWDSLGKAPVEKVKLTQKNTQNYKEIWENYKQIKANLEIISKDLEKNYLLFEKASDEQIEDIKNYENNKQNLKIERERAEEAYKKEKEVRDKYKDIIDLADEKQDAVREKWDLLRDKKDAEEEILRQKPQKANFALPITLGLVLSMIALALFRSQGIPVMVIASILGFMLGFGGSFFIFKNKIRPKNQEFDNLTQDLAEINERLRKCDDSLGEFADLDGLDLADFVQRIRAFKELTLADIEELYENLNTKIKVEKEFVEGLKGFTNTYSNLEEAYNLFLDLNREKRNLVVQINDYKTNYFDHDKWEETAAMVEVLLAKESGYFKDIESFMEEIEKLSPQWWQDKIEAGEKFERKLEAESDLSAVLENHNVTTVGELSEEKTHKANLSIVKMTSWVDFIKSNPGMPDMDHAKDPEKIAESIEKIIDESENIEEKIADLEEIKEEKTRELMRLEGLDPINIAIEEIDLKQMEERKTQLELRADAITLAYKELKATIALYNQNHQGRLADKATEYFSKISDNQDRKIVFDDEFKLGVIKDGRSIVIESLSKGARDQLYLSLRFAIADLISEDLGLPIVFDDPFTSSDQERLRRIKELLDDQKSERQFIMLAHSDQYRDWGKPIEVVG